MGTKCRTVEDDFPAFTGETVVAPCCGRLVGSDMLHYVGHLPAGLLDTMRRVANYACDGCRSVWFREGLILPSEYMTTHDIDASIIARYQAKEADAEMYPGGPGRSSPSPKFVGRSKPVADKKATNDTPTRPAPDLKPRG